VDDENFRLLYRSREVHKKLNMLNKIVEIIV